MAHKFKEGDKVRYKNADMWGVQTISGIYQDCYMFENNTPLTTSYVDDNFELVEDVLFKPKFKVGDRVKGKWSDETFSIKSIDDYGYLLGNNMFVDFPDENSLSLSYKFNVGDKVRNLTNNKVYDVVAITEKGYKIDKFEVPFNNESNWSLADERRFKIGDIVRWKNSYYQIVGLNDSSYECVCVSNNENHTLPYSKQRAFLLVKQHERTPKHKYKVGSKLCNKWNRNIYTIVAYTDKGYLLDDCGILYFDDKNWHLAYHKFNLGDIIVRKADSFYGTRYYVYTIGDDFYIIYPLVSGGLVDETKVDFADEDEWELLSDSFKKEIENKSDSSGKTLTFKSKISFDTDDSNDLLKILNKHINNAFLEAAERSKIGFYNLIDETLKFMDCDAYVDDARAGMRIFVKELKKKLSDE